MRGGELIGKVLEELESIVNRVAKAEVGESVMVCGRSVRWWMMRLRRRYRRDVWYTRG